MYPVGDSLGTSFDVVAELVQLQLSQASRQAALECRQKIVFKVPLVDKTVRTTHWGTGPGEECFMCNSRYPTLYVPTSDQTLVAGTCDLQ